MAGDFDQHDPKVFRETLGSFGTTTNPNARNQLEELQTKIRQGVKHVEIHLMNSGKGQFNIQDVPDKYGFEQRRTIMQLAKLNQQTLSVHGDFSTNSFSGLSQRGFDETYRAKNIKEIDETIKFAAETAKGGAVVFHLHETGLPPMPPQELNLPQWYLDKLKKEKPDEYKNIMEKHLNQFELDRQFVENPDQANELKVQYENFSADKKKKLKENFEIENWRDYFQYNKDEQIKLEQEGNPLVVIGNSITRATREQDVIDVDRGLEKLKDPKYEKFRKYLRSINIETDPKKFHLDDFQRIQARFINKNDYNRDDGLGKEEFRELRRFFVDEYVDVLNQNNRMKSLADKQYFEKAMAMQIKLAELQREDMDMNKARYEAYYKEIQNVKREERHLTKELREATRRGDKEKIRELAIRLDGPRDKNDYTEEMKKELEELAAKGGQRGENWTTREKWRYAELTGGLKEKKKNIEYYDVGQAEYHKLERYDEMMGQLNEQIKKIKEKKDNAKVLTDEIFEKNASAIGQLGIRALKYQLDMKEKAKIGKSKVQEYDKKIDDLMRKLDKTTELRERDKINSQINSLKYDKRLWVGTTDYNDIDVDERPLYIAPENIMAGYGYMDTLEEYKGVIRTAWDQFAQKLMSGEKEFDEIKKRYERETGKKITTFEQAREIAKHHIGGTFDNAHAGVWLKYFKRENGESEEHRIKRFNEWLNTEAENMAKEGVIKHIHFNDTQAKDDDHNLLGSGVLDIHDMRERLRKAGIKEALIVEAGGRGADRNMHITNAFDIFNPLLHTNAQERMEKGYGVGDGSVSDWINVKRDYEQRVEYSSYGMSYNTFNRASHTPQGVPKGVWSQTGFL